jgi:hypothetical protein
VKITFNVRRANVGNGGLDFRSAAGGFSTVRPGESRTLDFMAGTSMSITSFWPGSNVIKGVLKINVS